MKRRRIGLNPAARIRIGSTVLASAKIVDTSGFSRPLEAFAKIHQATVEAQQAVDDAQAKLQSAQTAVARLDAAQDDAVEALACQLAADGQRRRNPFAALGAPSPTALMKLSFAEEAKTLHRLCARVHDNHSFAITTHAAAQAADAAATIVEQALAALLPLQAALTVARQTRDAIGLQWDHSLAVLKRAVRAADNSAGHIYTVLFHAIRRPRRRRKPKAAPSGEV